MLGNGGNELFSIINGKIFVFSLLNFSAMAFAEVLNQEARELEAIGVA